jgi:hypothetical protein
MNQDSITVRLAGGLGNQLHGVAAGIACAVTLKCNLIIDPREIPYGSNTSRRFELQDLEMNLGQNPRIEFIPSNKFIQVHQMSRKILSRLSLKFPEMNPKVTYWDSAESPDIQVSKVQPGAILGGGFIDFRWMNLIADSRILGSIKLKNNSLQLERFSWLMGESFIALHIRVGDYVLHKDVFIDLPERYYLDAIEAALCGPKMKILIFTDDLMNGLLKYPEVFKRADRIVSVDAGLSAPETLYLMSLAKVVITANSTFSCWAGWFSEQNGGTVITPYQHLASPSSKDHFPNAWKRIVF